MFQQPAGQQAWQEAASALTLKPMPLAQPLSCTYSSLLPAPSHSLPLFLSPFFPAHSLQFLNTKNPLIYCNLQSNSSYLFIILHTYSPPSEPCLISRSVSFPCTYSIPLVPLSLHLSHLAVSILVKSNALSALCLT